MKVKNISIDLIEQNENSRVMYKTVDLAELMVSMKKDGLLQPVGVRPLDNGKYDAIWGNRRILAAKKLGWDEIPAHIFEATDDVERDFIGLVENFKRQNTSVAEDARIFQKFVDRGLSVSEIAARLDISEHRVQLSLDVLSKDVPEEYRQKIVHVTPGDHRSAKDKIPSSTAFAIMNLRRHEKLNRAQTRSLFAYVEENRPTIGQLQKIAPLVRSGVTIEEAIERVASLDRVCVTFFIPIKTIEKLQKKYGKKIHDVVKDYVSSNKEFNITDKESLKNGPEVRGLSTRRAARNIFQQLSVTNGV